MILDGLPRFSCGRDREVAASARCGDSEQQDCGISETILVPSAIESDTTDSAETADRGAAGSEDTLPCAPQPEPEPACTHWHPGPSPRGRDDDQRLTERPLAGASTSRWRSQTLAALGPSLRFDISLELAHPGRTRKWKGEDVQATRGGDLRASGEVTPTATP